MIEAIKFMQTMEKIQNMPGATEEEIDKTASAMEALARNEEPMPTIEFSVCAGEICAPVAAEKKKPAKFNHATRRRLRLAMRKKATKAARRDRAITKCANCGLAFIAPASSRCQCPASIDGRLRYRLAEVA